MACAAVGAVTVPSGVRAQDSEIRIVAVDSSRLPPESVPPGRQHDRRPVGDAIGDLVRDINQRGGLLGRRLAVTRENDRCEADEAAAVATRAVDHGAHVVIGHACSSGAIRAAAIYAEGGVVMIATGPRHPRLTTPAARPGIFRLAGRDDRQVESIAALIATSFAGARPAIVHDQSLHGRGMADEVRRRMVAANVTPVLVASYASVVKDYAALVAQLIEAKVDLVVFPGQPFEASIIVDEVRRAGGRIETAIGTDVLAADAPPARLLAATGQFLVMLPWPGWQADLAAGSRSADGASDNASALAKVALEIWVEAVSRAQTLAPDGVSAALRQPAADTGLGAIRFDDKGDAAVPSFLPHVWRDGRWQVRR